VMTRISPERLPSRKMGVARSLQGRTPRVHRTRHARLRHDSENPMSFDLDGCVSTMTPLIRDAGRVALDWYRRPVQVTNKSDQTDYDPVTEADRRIETLLRSAIEDRFADHAITGEEFGTTGDGPYHWLIDPIDGTRAFVIGQPMWGTLVGLQHGKTVLAGWMYVPPLDEMFVGSLGSTRWQGPEEHRTLATRSVAIEDAILAATHPAMFSTDDERDAFGRVDAAVKMTRFGGDCLNYGLLAMGLIDVVVEAKLQPYDIVALIPIIEGAGGVITDRSGAAPLDGGFVVAAGTAALHAEVLDLVNG
jgi:histidinol phosphatase-like enzyme (inositol monophosphatase family)